MAFMIRSFFILFLVSWACIPAAGALELVDIGQPQQFVPTPDKPAPASEADWIPFVPRAPSDDGTVIMRHRIDLQLDGEERLHNPLAIGVRLYGVYDFYWDGELIGSNRHKGEAASQFSRVIVPLRALTPGPHEIRMRITALGLEEGEGLNMWVAPAAVRSDFFGIHPTVVSTFFVATGAFLTGCYLFLLWRAGEDRPGLLPATFLCFAVVAIILLAETRHHFAYPYAWQPSLDSLRLPVSLAIFSLLAWVTIARLALAPRWRWFLLAPGLLILSLVPVAGIDQDTRAFGLLAVAMLGLSLYGWYLKRPAARIFSAGFALAALALALDPDQKHAFLIVITLLLASDLARDIRQRAQKAQQLALLSERLRADLVKRTIQPHFLMNSLTALMEWVETDPDEAVEFIDGLAQEFRLLADFADRNAVRLDEELALVKTHMALMSRRLSGHISLTVEADDTSLLVPPGIFHTLVENAFSHNNYSGQTTTFRLEVAPADGGTRFRLSVPVGEAGMTGLGTGLGTGTGSRYVTARLEEFCGKAFRFHGERVGSDWQTTIDIGEDRPGAA